MKEVLKTLFVELFTLMAWVTLVGYVVYCETMGIETDSVRDAWNILLLIAGFVWGRGAKEGKKTGEPGTITVPEQQIETEKPKEESK